MRYLWITVAMLGVAGCGSNEGPGEPVSNEALADAAVAERNDAAPALPPCPFRRTTGWSGSWEDGWLLVVGRADLQMAGFKAELTPRQGAAQGTLALDLTLRPEPTAAVSDKLRYERRGAPAYARTEIWCGGERIEAFDNVIVAQ